MRWRNEKDFMTFFEENTGRYFRTGIMRNGRDTGEEPFMASFPELLDVGIMGHCKHGKSGLCRKAGIECYQDGLHSEQPNMSLEDFRWIAEQCKGQTYQFALGGCGDPDQHEQFEEILKICRKNHIVPNFTTSGLGMTPEIAQFCKEYCGAVAVSWYRSSYTIKAIKILLDEGVKTNIHYVLSNHTLEEAIIRLKEQDFPEGINAVIFLLHKPVGLGSAENVIHVNNPLWKEFLECITGRTSGSFGKNNFRFKIGFDSCTVPALFHQMEMSVPSDEASGIDPDSLDTCEGARWSAYITPDRKMLPCSFDNQQQRWAVDLRKYSVKEAWDSDVFEDFRKHFRRSCPDCSKRNRCMGGCPICPEIVLCSRKAEKQSQLGVLEEAEQIKVSDNLMLKS